MLRKFNRLEIISRYDFYEIITALIFFSLFFIPYSCFWTAKHQSKEKEEKKLSTIKKWGENEFSFLPFKDHLKMKNKKKKKLFLAAVYGLIRSKEFWIESNYEWNERSEWNKNGLHVQMSVSFFLETVREIFLCHKCWEEKRKKVGKKKV